MFRTLAGRLTATYVFAAIVLVVIVIAAVTAFALSMWGVATQEAALAVARQIPDEVRQQVARDGTLDKAAGAIARHLMRPGLRVAIFRTDQNGRRTFLAATRPIDESGRSAVVTNGDALFPRDAGPPPPPDDPRVRNAPRPDEHMPPLPFGLGTVMHLSPLDIAIPGGRIRIFPDPGPLARTINLFWLAMIPIGTFVVLAAWLLGRYIAGEALRPLVETTASLHRFGAGDFTPRPVDRLERNEIGELVLAYNAAAAQVGAAFEERRLAETQMRQFVADAGHELRTPLTVIMGFVDVLRRRREHDAGTGRIYDTMLLESRRMRALIEKLILLARLEHPNDRPIGDDVVDLAELAERVATVHDVRAAVSRIVVSRDGRPLARGDENELYDALCNLVENAVKYAPDAPIEIRAYERGGSAHVDVIDRGPGIPSDERSRVFDRFYRGRDRDATTEGFGLGLAIAKRAVERAGGTLSLQSEDGAGCAFSIALPLVPRGEAVPAAV